MDGDGFTVFEFVTPSKHTPRWVLKHLQQLGKGERNDLFSLIANGDELSIMDGDGFTVFEFVTPSKHTPRWVLKHLQQLGKGERNDLLKFSGRNEEEPNDYACVGQCLLKQRFPIRLRGVDAPEADQPYGIESRDALRKMLKGKRVQIVAYELCPHKRYLANVYVENKCVQELLLQEAAVWYLEKGSRQEQSWMKLHYSNKRNRKGLWGPPGASSGYQPTFPWRWRYLSDVQKQDIWKKGISSVLGVFFILAVVHLQGPLFVSTFNPLVLVFVAIAGFLILDEKLYVGSLLGSVIVIVGLYLVLWGKSKDIKRSLKPTPSNNSKDVNDISNTIADTMTLETISVARTSSSANVDEGDELPVKSLCEKHDEPEIAEEF
ncbi:hypothetical protein SSX86_005457 [Deinandra increscens subsp. villosa]|uniref:TNase-like domain-containing protein n=1 Tax=Deinandra increscens subsp. villosa TaxID=3103831 RepID=A0AAP0DLY4_9ASTR